MRSKLFAVLFSIVLLLMAFSSAAAAGPTVEQLENAGWFCFIPPNSGLGFHCWRPERSPLTGSPTSVPVLFFDPNTEEFVGTEILLNTDVYGEQPCPQEGESSYHILPFPYANYAACHHST